MEVKRIYKDVGVLRLWYQVSDSSGSHCVEILRTDPREVPTEGE